ncbi:MAG: hypothetical protein PVF70_14325 [Anaerolineales bacterium]|jgi:hypothetical protein
MVRNSRMTWVIQTALVLLLLSSCGGSPTAETTNTPAAPGEPSSPASVYQLAPGEVLESAEGLALGAVENAIPATVEVDIRKMQLASDHPQLPTDVTIPGFGFEVAITGEVDQTVLDPLVVGLPLPDQAAVDHAQLALILLIRGHEIDPPGNDTWEIRAGFVDEEKGLFVTTLPSAPTQARIMFVAASQGFESPPITDIELPADTEFDSQGIADGAHYLFWARCVGYPPGDTLCGQDERDAVTQALGFRYQELVDEVGYHLPHLRRQLLAVKMYPPSRQLGPYEVDIMNGEIVNFRDLWVDCNILRERGQLFSRGRGFYRYWSRRLVVCLDSAVHTAIDTAVAEHEFFHSLQYGYPEMLANAEQRERAFIEGTAVTSENSNDELVRSTGRDPRPVNETLIRPHDDAVQLDYQAQDFFVYLGRRFGLGMEMFIPMLEAGGLREDIDDVLGSGAPFPDGYSLGSAFWDWAKNQAFENAVEFPLLGDPCVRKPDIVPFASISYRPGAPPDPVEFDIDPLSAVAYRISLTAIDTPYATDISIFGDLDRLSAKLYDSPPATPTDCHDTEDALVNRVQVEPGEDREVFLLIGNTDLGAEASGSIRFTPAIGVRIISPEDGATNPHGTAFELEAEFFLAGVRQIRPTGPVEWRVDSPEGRIIARGALAAAALDAGTHDIFVLYGTAVDQVSVTVLEPPPTAVPTGSVSGIVFQDNAPPFGVYNSGDDLLSGAAVTARIGACPGATEVALDWTGGNGAYSIGGLPAGSYCLYVTLAPKDAGIMLFQHPRTITITGGGNLTGINFWGN